MKTLRALLGAATALLFMLAPAPAALDIKENGGSGDGLGDIWQLMHNMNGASPTQDSDGDGASNANEAGAGTNPNAPGDLVKVNSITLTGGNVVLKWPSVLGKRYRVQKTATLNVPGSWTDVTPFVNGTDAEMTESTPAQSGAVYRVAVYDMDTDGDGVTDWEERQLGLDPENSHSHGPGYGNDLTWATQAINTTPAQQVVTIQATVPVAQESGYPGQFTLTRAAGIASLPVTYTVSGSASSGTDYTALSGTVAFPFGASTATIEVTPLSDAAVESPEAVVVTLSTGASYTLGQPRIASVLIEDQTTVSGTGLKAEYWNEISSGAGQLSTTNPAKFAGNPNVSPVNPTAINFTWPDGSTQGTNSPAAGITTNYFASRWSGEILPGFSQIYTFEYQVNLGGRVWVNGQLVVNNWPTPAVSSGTYSGIISLEAGKRYPIVVEQYETTGSAEAILRWSGANLPEEVIPANRLFPTVAPQILSPLEALTFLNVPSFSYQIVASASPTSYSAHNLPPGLSINTTNGLISGSPTASGLWNITLTATNANGSGSAVLALNVLQTGGGIVREVWNSLPGTDVTTIPLGTAPAATSTISSLQAPANAGDNFGARIRGYVHAPATGVYQFWLSADHAAELYLSDDAEPVNAWLRAKTTAATSVPPNWGTAIKTPLLYLKSGNKYYIEVRHKESSGNDHLAVGWSKPGEPTTAPSEIIPGYLLSQYAPPAPVSGQSTLYVTSMTAQSGAATNGYGSAILQMNAEKTQATVRYQHSNLTGPVAQKHVHSGADGGLILFDMDVTPPNPDGSYTWNIAAVPGVTDKDGDSDSDAADVVRLIEDGSSYINLHTALYPAGEVKGFYRIVSGSQTFVPPPGVPDWTTDPNNAATIPANASRFLQQATFGPSPEDMADVEALGYEGWIDMQFNRPVTRHYPTVFANRNTTNPDNSTYGGDLTFNAWWQHSVLADDQLRQRVAFALSEILVVSEAGPLDDRADTLSDYYDMLLIGHLDPASPNNLPNPVPSPVLRVIPGVTGFDGGSTLNSGAFGNFRDILIATTLHPAMGRYLDMLRNDKPDITTGRIPNENYAREILQLFSLGLNRLHPDGSLILDSNGLPIPTYDQDAVIGLSHVFTGWEYFYAGAYRTSFNAGSNWIEPMREVPTNHYTGQKRMLNNVVFPGLYNLTTSTGTPLAVNPDADYASGSGNNQLIREDDEFQALAAQELLAAHDQIFNHPNIGPFICRQLIQRLVTSTPSRGYIHRVVQKFNDNGSGVRGDMKAVVKAILLDYEARSITAAATIGYGKQREPLLRVTGVARAFPASEGFAGTWDQDGGAITVRTAVPHRLSSSQTVTLNFGDNTPETGLPLATSGTYSQSTVGGSVALTATQFGARTKDVHRGSYAFNPSGSTTVRVTTQVDHGLSSGHRAFVSFRSGGLTNGLFPITRIDADEFTIDVGVTGTLTAQSCDVAFLRGGYVATRAAGTDLTGPATITTNTVHGLAVGNEVWIDFTLDTSGSGSYSPTDGLYQITTVNSPTQFVITANWDAAIPTGTTSLSTSFNGASASQPLIRGGHATVSPATPGFAVTTALTNFTMGSTDTDLAQTPMRSPTVFNFFLPDYQYPGELAQAGLITPEFELTSDTTVVRQHNFLYEGIFNPNYVTGISTFRNGGADIAMDYGKWMDIRPGSPNPWTDNNASNPTNDNLRNLIRELSKLLMAGQMTPAMEDAIYAYVSNNTTSGGNPNGNIAYTNGTTATFATADNTMLTHRRNRVRAVIHLIVTSPQFTIQK